MNNENIENKLDDGEPGNEQYIKTIEELRANTVSREKYKALEQDNKRLLEALASGQTVEAAPQKAPDIQEMRKILLEGGDLSNLEYVRNILDLRDALLANGERDPFLPIGSHAVVAKETLEAIDRVAAGLREMVEFADGDSGIFTAEYQRRVQDPALYRGKR